MSDGFVFVSVQLYLFLVQVELSKEKSQIKYVHQYKQLFHAFILKERKGVIQLHIILYTSYLVTFECSEIFGTAVKSEMK